MLPCDICSLVIYPKSSVFVQKEFTVITDLRQALKAHNKPLMMNTYIYIIRCKNPSIHSPMHSSETPSQSVNCITLYGHNFLISGTFLVCFHHFYHFVPFLCAQL